MKVSATISGGTLLLHCGPFPLHSVTGNGMAGPVPRARRILRSYKPGRLGIGTGLQIMLNCARHFDCAPDALIGPVRTAELVRVRAVAAWMMKERMKPTPTNTEVGAALGRSTSNVEHLMRKARRLMSESPAFADEVEQLCEETFNRKKS